MDKVNVRPITFDKLIRFDEQELDARRQAVDKHLATFEERCATLKDALDEAERITRFLRKEQVQAALAIKLQRGDVVRVICSKCGGSGMKPTDVLSGRVQRQTAFETVGDEPTLISARAEVPERDRCEECKGNRWVLMDRFKG